MMDKKVESRLKSIEYHLGVAKDVETNSALVIHHARTDLLTTDIPYLLELVRSQAQELEMKNLPNKRFTEAELGASYWFMRWVRCSALRLSDYGGPSELDNERLATLRRFASLPHYDEGE
jgi:hypothetical protein